jgi:hypothetical protein
MDHPELRELARADDPATQHDHFAAGHRQLAATAS